MIIRTTRWLFHAVVLIENCTTSMVDFVTVGRGSIGALLRAKRAFNVAC